MHDGNRNLRNCWFSRIENTQFLNDFLLPSSVTHANTNPNETEYLIALNLLFNKFGPELSVVQSHYEIVVQVEEQNQGTTEVVVDLYDIKCKSRFEDDVIAKFYEEWPEILNNHQHLGIQGNICPFRRGMCVGLINNQLLLSIGNAKFMYGSSEEICSLSSSSFEDLVVLTEKANGEYTTCTIVKEKQRPWIVVGSKNVRLALPFYYENPEKTLSLLNEFIKTVVQKNTNDIVAVIGLDDNNNNNPPQQRYSYLKDMFTLWMNKLTKLSPQSSPLIWNLLESCTLIGEQVGVHAHIFTGYHGNDIRLFGALDKSLLTKQLGCDVLGLERMITNEAKGILSVVSMKSYKVPQNMSELAQALDQIASGSMEVHGEGVVVYKYTFKEEKMLLQGLWKFKCEEYAFDRRFRTLLTPCAATLQKTGMTIAQLYEEILRIQAALAASKVQFPRMNHYRQDSRIALVPYVLIFLERHQATRLCSDFSDHFVYICKVCEESKPLYEDQVSRLMSVRDTIRSNVESVLLTHEATLKKTLQDLRTVDEISLELAELIVNNQAQYRAFGICAAPASGKSALLPRICEILSSKYQIISKVCDRDRYAIDIGGDINHTLVHNRWMEDIKGIIDQGGIALIGNCFTGAFADRLEKQIGQKILLAVHTETSEMLSTKMNKMKKEKIAMLYHSLRFQLVCLERLLNRSGLDCGSTLTMALGGNIVLNKFFASVPDEPMLKARLQTSSAYMFSSLKPESRLPEQSNTIEFEQILRALLDLKNQVSHQAAASRAKKRDSSSMMEIDSGLSSSATDILELSSKAKVLRYRYHVREFPFLLNEFPVGEKCVFVAFEPNDKTAFELYHRYTNPKLVRADGHMTIVFNPSLDKIHELSFLDVSKGMIEIPLTHKVSVSKHSSNNHLLEFLIADFQTIVCAEQNDLHVTLGSTDIDVLPHAISSTILAHLRKNPNLLDCSNPIEITVPSSPKPDSPLLDVLIHVESLPSPFLYEGKLKMFCFKE